MRWYSGGLRSKGCRSLVMLLSLTFSPALVSGQSAASASGGSYGNAGTSVQAMPAQVFSLKALAAYVFAGIVPGLLAYAGFAWLGGKFGSVRTSLVLYLGPVASALLSFLILGEPPQPIHFAGGLLILGGVWASLRK